MAAPSSELEREAIDAFLGQHGTGVLALARDDVPYAVPVSYGFDSADRAFYLRLSLHPESLKRRFLDGAAPSQLVVYERVDAEWWSVIATGVLAGVSDADITPQVAEGLRNADLPLIDIVDDSPETLQWRIFRLSVEELTGRTTAPT